MQWLAHLVARLGTSGAFSNASIALAEEREAADRIECFLLRFAHPAGAERTPVEPAAGQATQVA